MFTILLYKIYSKILYSISSNCCYKKKKKKLYLIPYLCHTFLYYILINLYSCKHPHFVTKHLLKDEVVILKTNRRGKKRDGVTQSLFGQPFFITQFTSLNFHHSTLNFSHPFGIITQFPSLNIFHTICGPIHVSRCNFFFFLELR